MHVKASSSSLSEEEEEKDCVNNNWQKNNSCEKNLSCEKRWHTSEAMSSNPLNCLLFSCSIILYNSGSASERDTLPMSFGTTDDMMATVYSKCVLWCFLLWCLIWDSSGRKISFGNLQLPVWRCWTRAHKGAKIQCNTKSSVCGTDLYSDPNEIKWKLGLMFDEGLSFIPWLSP